MTSKIKSNVKIFLKILLYATNSYKIVKSAKESEESKEEEFHKDSMREIRQSLRLLNFKIL